MTPALGVEIERLRAELARLQATAPAAQPPFVTERRGWGRPVVAGVLVVLAALLAPLSVLATLDVDAAVDEVVTAPEGRGLPDRAAAR